MFNLFKKPAPVIEDKIFGKLKYFTRNNSSLGFFSGNILFEPLNKNIECLIDADTGGPKVEQQEFYKTIQKKYRGLITSAIPLIKSEFEAWDENLKITEFDKDFNLIAISIPVLDKTPVIWDLAFNIVQDEGGHHLTITFQDFEPKEALIDG
ncbi:MAG: hypothetical protein KBB91_02025 [Candidatus Pacebacteria bacterium]|nr:hypothetical protein [Candidatus Paceibacterota bacterium]